VRRKTLQDSGDVRSPKRATKFRVQLRHLVWRICFVDHRQVFGF
jgi:hypothetical protein